MCRDRDQKAVLTLSWFTSLPSLPARPFLFLTHCTKDNCIRQAIFLLTCGKPEPCTPPLHHSTARRPHQQHHHCPQGTQYLGIRKIHARMCVALPDPICSKRSSSFAKPHIWKELHPVGAFISPDKPVPVSHTSQIHFKQETWTNSSFCKSKPALGTQTKLELFFEAWLAYLGGQCHYLAGFIALLLTDSSAAAPDVSEKVVTTTLLPERTHNSCFPFPMQEWSCVHWRQQVASGSGAAWHTWDTHSSSDTPQLQGSPSSFQNYGHFI